MEQQATELTTGGWVFLIIAWTVITGLTAACFYRVRKAEIGPGGISGFRRDSRFSPRASRFPGGFAVSPP